MSSSQNLKNVMHRVCGDQDAANEIASAVDKASDITATAAAVNAAATYVGALTATVAEANINDNLAATFTFSPAAGGANVCEVTVTAKDAAGSTIAEAFTYDIWLTDAASGAGLTGTTASGTVTVKTASGVVISTYTAKKALRVQSLATGVFILEITDSAKTAFRVAISNPATGKTIVSSALATGNYGA